MVHGNAICRLVCFFLGLTNSIYKNASLYLSFDYDEIAEHGEFTYKFTDQNKKCNTMLNTGICINQARFQVGSLNDGCLTSNNCASDFLINFWYMYSGESPLNQEVSVLSLGLLNFTILNRKYPTPTTGYIQWVDDQCKFSFQIPVKSWVYVSILVQSSSNTTELYFNGEQYFPQESCVVSSLSTGDMNVTDLIIGFLRIDEFSIFPYNMNVSIPFLYQSVVNGELLLYSFFATKISNNS